MQGIDGHVAAGLGRERAEGPSSSRAALGRNSEGWVAIMADHTELLRDRLFIAGDWIGEATGGTFEHVNPATGSAQATLPMAGPAEVDAAVSAAQAAFAQWRDWPANERRDLLFAIADAMEARADEFVQIGVLEGGMPIALAPTVNSALPVEYFRYYAGWVDKIHGSVVPTYPVTALDYTRREPYGVIAVVIPWNGPCSSLGQKVAPALAAGNCVVLKPSELAPFSSLLFAEICAEVGLPPGVLNVLIGGPETGSALVGHPDVAKVTFTGGGVTGRKVLMAAAENLTPVVLELGGKSANLVFEDADIDAAVFTAVSMGVAALSGQACLLPTRLLVQDSVYDEVVDQVVEISETLQVGDPWDESTMMGPLITDASARRVLAIVERAKSEQAGKLLTGGARLNGDLAMGNFVAPTVFGDVDPQSHLAREEVFGPVLSIIRFKDEGQAVRIANDSDYGLGGFVFTSDLARAHTVAAQLDAGYIGVNHFPVLPPTAPFGGVKKSGFGREGGEPGLLEFLREKNVNISLER
ncbi:MAG: aldehyde dehydrogenase family protein [Aeromicrobium sp.]